MERPGIVAATLITLAMSVGHARADAPRTEQQQAADKLFAEGRDLLVNKKDPKAACEKFELAAAADNTAAGTMLNLGLCYEELGKIHTAIEWFRKAKTRASESKLPDHEQAATEHMQKLKDSVPVIAIAFGGVAPTDPQVRIDGKDVSATDLAHLEVDPGDHTVEVRASHRKIARQQITVAPKDAAHADILEVKIALEEGEPTAVVDKGKKQRLVAYGLGVVALGAWTFDFFYGVAKSKNYHCAIDKPPDPSCSSVGHAGDIDFANKQVHSLAYTGTTVFVIGAAALAAGAYLFFSAPGKVTVEQVGGEHMSLAPVLGPGQVGVALSGGF